MPKPDGENEAVDLRLLRAEDLLVARVTAPGCHLEDGETGPELVAETDTASVILHLPPQHLGEHAVLEGTAFTGPSAHRAAEASRLVFALTGGTRIAFTLEALLTILPTLRMRVAPHATPAPPPPVGVVGEAVWTDAVLVPGWQQLVERAEAAEPGDLVFGIDRAAAYAASSLDGPAARILQHAQASRIVSGLSRPVMGPSKSSTVAGSGVGGLGSRAVWRAGPADLLPQGPRRPTDDETSIEAPYRVEVSPSVQGSFSHDPAPTTAPDDPTRAELWRTHLTVRVEDENGALLRLDDADDNQRIVRAVWSRDLEPPSADADFDPAPLNPQSLNPQDRRALVRQTSDGRLPTPPRPLSVRSFSLSSLGAWIDWAGSWDEAEVLNPPAHTNLVGSYRHQAIMGRDQYVRVAYPGFLYPFGHRAMFVVVTERKVANRADAVAALWQRSFIVVRQPSRSYPGHDSPWAKVSIEPLVTPDLTPHPELAEPFVPLRDGKPFEFSLITTDRAGVVSAFSAALAFVPTQSFSAGPPAQTIQQRTEQIYADVEQIRGRGQKLALAQEATAGDTAVETNHLVFHGEIDVEARTSRPTLSRLNAVVPAMRHLAPAAPGVDLVYSAAFLGADANGFGATNPGQLFLSLPWARAVDFSGGSERSGGFLSPNFLVRAMSRSLGAVGEDGTKPDSGLAQGKFNPASFLEGAMPKLFGLFSLLDLLDTLGAGLDDAPEFVTEALDTVSSIVSEADRLRAAASEIAPRLDQEIARAAHAGAGAGLLALKAELDAVITPLLAALRALLDALGALPTSPDIAAVASALNQVTARVNDLLAKLGAPQLPVAVKASLDRPARALAALATAADTLAAVENFAQNLLSPSTAVTARFEWRPVLHSWPVNKEPVFKVQDSRCLRLAIEVRASASTPPSVDVAAEITNFTLQLLPDAQLMGLTFSRIGFRVSSGGKPQVDVVFDGIEFLGPLSFIDTLRRMIPFDGFADPPFVDVSPDGVTAGFDLALPNVAVGVFSLENIALGADARVPFLGDAVSVGFHFCSKDSPFRLTVMCVGGGGWVEMRATPKGLVLLEMGLEACASLSIDLGVASGSVSISVGVYLRLEAAKGLLTAYFRIRGEVDVLGLISASITLELSLAYHFETGELIGRASLVVEIEVLFFSASVEITVERKLAGSKGDPVLAQVLPHAPDGSNADWSAYCEAFAPVPAP